MIYPARGKDRDLEKFTDPFGNEYWFWQNHVVAFRHHLAAEISVLQNSFGQSCGRALNKSFGPDPHYDRRLQKEAFAEKFAQDFGTAAGHPSIQYDIG